MDVDEDVGEDAQTSRTKRRRAPTAPSHAAVARSPPSLLQSRTVKRAKRPSAAIACAAAVAGFAGVDVSTDNDATVAESLDDDAATSNESSAVVAIPAAIQPPMLPLATL